MTFSIAGRCPRTGRLGIAISSSSPAVAARCVHLRSGVGAVCSQNITDPRLGPAVLGLLALGAAPAAALDVLRAREHIAYRQVTALATTGRGAFFSGTETLGVHAAGIGEDCVAAGNMLGDAGTPASPSMFPAATQSSPMPAAMIAAFERTDGDLGGRLIAALGAGLAAGGEAGPVRSAGLSVMGKAAWRETDLRVDWDETDPVARLATLWHLWSPQAADYIERALNPSQAPSYRSL